MIEQGSLKKIIEEFFFFFLLPRVKSEWLFAIPCLKKKIFQEKKNFDFTLSNNGYLHNRCVGLIKKAPISNPLNSGFA